MQNIVNTLIGRIYLLLLSSIAIMLLYGLLSYDGGLLELYSLKSQLQVQDQEVLAMGSRNAKMYQRISVLRSSPLALESQARLELGLVKPNETYYQVVLPVGEAGVSGST